MNINRNIAIPIQLLKDAIRKKDGLSLNELAIFFKGKHTILNSIISGKDDNSVAKQLGVNIGTYKTYKKSLIKHGLLIEDNVNTRLISVYKLIDFTNDKFCWLSFSGCKSLQSYKDRLSIFIIKDSVDTNNNIAKHVSKEFTLKQLKGLKKLVKEIDHVVDLHPTLVGLHQNKDSFNENVNACVGIKQLERKTGLAKSSISRIIDRNKASGVISSTEVWYSTKIRFNYKLSPEQLSESKPNKYCYAYQKNDRIYYHHGSVIKVNCVDTFYVKDKISFFNRMEERKKQYIAIRGAANSDSSLLKTVLVSI